MDEHSDRGVEGRDPVVTNDQLQDDWIRVSGLKVEILIPLINIGVHSDDTRNLIHNEHGVVEAICRKHERDINTSTHAIASDLLKFPRDGSV